MKTLAPAPDSASVGRTLAVLALGLVVSTAQATLNNPSFDDGLNGWTVARDVVLLSTPNTLVIGGNGSALIEKGSLSQSFNAIAGTHYFISFDTRSSGGNVENLLGILAFGGVQRATQFSTDAGSVVRNQGVDWLAPSSGVATFSICGDCSNQGGGVIDNFSFRAVTPVPEPGTWALMLGGLGVLGAAHRRRQVKTST